MELKKERMLQIAKEKEYVAKHVELSCGNCGSVIMQYDEEEAAFYEKVIELMQADAEGQMIVMPCKVGDAIDKLFSHNEIIALWYKTQKDRDHSYLLWKGEAWSIPKKYKKQRILKFFGTIPEKITESDTLNLLVTPYLRPCNEDEMQEGENDG